MADIGSLLEKANQTDLIVLPEVFSIRGDDALLRESAEPLDGDILTIVRTWASDRGCWLLAGSVLEKDGNTIYNTSVLIDRGGGIAATYRKIHLFEVHLEDGKVVREADVYSAGKEPVTADIEGWTCGLSICYDLRFPELYRHYASQGASLLFAPSNFTQRTGKDHWDVLVRARAIENQCFMLAPGQCGTHPEKDIETHGHSMIVGPWGEVLAQADDEVMILSAVLDPTLLEQTRNRVPALRHRKLFSDIS